MDERTTLYNTQKMCFKTDANKKRAIRVRDPINTSKNTEKKNIYHLHKKQTNKRILTLKSRLRLKSRLSYIQYS